MQKLKIYSCTRNIYRTHCKPQSHLNHGFPRKNPWFQMKKTTVSGTKNQGFPFHFQMQYKSTVFPEKYGVLGDFNKNRTLIFRKPWFRGPKIPFFPSEKPYFSKVRSLPYNYAVFFQKKVRCGQKRPCSVTRLVTRVRCIVARQLLPAMVGVFSLEGVPPSA